MPLLSQTPITFTVNAAASGVTVGGTGNHTVNITTLSTNVNNVLRTGTDGGLIVGLSTDSGNLLDLGTDNNLYFSTSVLCDSLNNCELSALGDVSNSAAASGNLLYHNGIEWGPRNIGTRNLSDVFNSAPTNGQVLKYNTVFSQYVPSSTLESFSISGGGATQTINSSTNVIHFQASGDLSVLVSSPDTVTYGFTEALTTLTFNSGTNQLTYTDENGTPNSINLNLPSGGGSEFACSMLSSCSVNTLNDVNVGSAVSGVFMKYDGTNWVPGSGFTFSCTDLNTCSINSLSDVTISAPSSNQILRWNGSNWVNSAENLAGSYSFSISGGGVTQAINSGDTVRFADSNCISAVVSATDTVTFSPVLSPAQTWSGGDEPIGQEFGNALTCTSSGLFVPCLIVEEPTPTVDGRIPFKVPCNGTWVQYDMIWFDQVTLEAVVHEDPATVGSRLNVNPATGELFYTSNDDLFEKVPGTYGYAATTNFSAGTPKQVIHDLGSTDIIVQVWYNNILKYATTVEILGVDTIRLTTADTGNHRVVIYPVENLV